MKSVVVVACHSSGHLSPRYIQIPSPDCEVTCRGQPDAEAAVGLPEVG